MSQPQPLSRAELCRHCFTRRGPDQTLCPTCGRSFDPPAPPEPRTPPTAEEQARRRANHAVEQRNFRTCGIIFVVALVSVCASYALLFAVMGQLVDSTLMARLGRTNGAQVAAIYPTDTPLPPFATPPGGVTAGDQAALALVGEQMSNAERQVTQLAGEIDATDFYAAAWKGRVTATAQALAGFVTSTRVTPPPATLGITAQWERTLTYLDATAHDFDQAANLKFAPMVQILPYDVQRSRTAVSATTDQLRLLQNGLKP